MSEVPVILITEPEKQLIEKSGIEIEINNYDNSHLYYKGFDLGNLKEITNSRQENQQLKIQISAGEEEYRKLENNWNKLKGFIINEIPEEEFVNNEYYVSILDKMVELERDVSDE